MTQPVAVTGPKEREQPLAATGWFDAPTPHFRIVLIQLGAVTWHLPLEFLAQNWRANPSMASAVITATLVMVIATTSYAILRGTRLSPWAALSVVTVMSFVFWHWNSLESDVLVSILLTALALFGVVRFSDTRVARLTLFAVSVGAAAFAAGHLLIEAIRTPGPSVAVPEVKIVEAPNSDRPDIYMMVVDAYGRSDVLWDDYGYSNQGFVEELRSQGFTVVNNSETNYSATHHSVASTLSMSYLGDPTLVVSPQDMRTLSDIIGGHNTTARTLQSLGYSYIHGSGEWWGSRCGPLVDICLPGQLIDLTAFELLSHTPLNALLYRVSGDPGTRITLDLLDTFRNWESISAPWEHGPRFVFVHVPAPHPPLYLDSVCEPRPRETLAGRVINTGYHSGDELALRKQGYVEQIKCANEVIQAFIEAAPGDALILIVSDHGPDSRGQLGIHPESWGPDETRERFGILMAMRSPCEEPTSEYAINSMRAIMRCAFDADLPDLPGEQWIVPGYFHRTPIIPIPHMTDSRN